MTDAGDITAEIGEECSVDHGEQVYWVSGWTDVSDLPTVDGVQPVPDPSEQS